MMPVRNRTVSVLELLAQHVGGLPMSKVGDTLEIPRAAAHRLLAELKDTGYVKQDPQTAQYMLTVKLASLGLGFLASTGITDVSQPLLDDLAEVSGELVRLAVVEGDQLIWVAKAQGATTGLRYDPDAGMIVYLPATANGLAWLATLDEESALMLIARQGMELVRERGPGAPQTLRELLSRVQETKQQGYATVFDAYEPGTSAMAAAVPSHTGDSIIGTVSIAGPSIRMTKTRMQQLAPKLLECAKALGVASRNAPVFAKVRGSEAR